MHKLNICEMQQQSTCIYYIYHATESLFSIQVSLSQSLVITIRFVLYSIKRFCRVSLHLPYTIVIIIYEFTEPIPSSLFTAPSTLDAIMDHDMSAGEARKNYISLKIAWYNNEPGFTLYQYTIATGCRYRHRLTTAATI